MIEKKRLQKFAIAVCIACKVKDHFLYVHRSSEQFCRNVCRNFSFLDTCFEDKPDKFQTNNEIGTKSFKWTLVMVQSD